MSIDRHLHESDNKKKSPSPVAQPAATGEFFSPVDTSYQHVMFLQRTVGNRAVRDLMTQRRAPSIQREEAPAAEGEQEVPIQQLDNVQLEGRPSTPDETDHGRVVNLHAVTKAAWSSSTNSAQTQNIQVSRSTGCDGCSDTDPCVQVTASVVCTYSVPISVQLPDLSAMDLNECERQQCQNWIDTVLAPHEQEHVAAFSTYNGTTTRTLSFKSCQSAAASERDRRVQEMLDEEIASRQSAAQTLSDALDPFNMDFEINCPEPEEEAEEAPEAEVPAPVE